MTTLLEYSYKQKTSKFPLLNEKAHLNCVFLCCSYQDTHNRAYYMVLVETRWLGIRLDLLSALLIGAVALLAALYSHNNGKEMIYLALFFSCFFFPMCSLKTTNFHTLLWSGRKWPPGILLVKFCFNFLVEITMWPDDSSEYSSVFGIGLKYQG